MKDVIPVGDDRCRFDSSALEQEIQNMIEKKLGSKTCTMSQVSVMSKTAKPTFVVAKKALHADGPPTVFRSYKGVGVRSSKCPIWEAARATSAAPSYFKEMYIRTPPPGLNYVDGGLGHNNPSQVAQNEARLLWPTIRHFGIVSIGTGRHVGVQVVDPAKPIDDVETQRSVFKRMMSWLPRFEDIVPQWKTVKNFPPGVLALIKMAHALTSLVTDSENVHQELQRASRDPDAEKRFPYFRFNVQREVGDIGLADVEKQEKMTADTISYLEEDETKELKGKCVEFLSTPPKAFRTIISLNV